MDSKCGCVKCLNEREETLFGLPIEMAIMILCPKCGNKRCPHATDHNYECTGSNEPGQEGSRYA